MLSFLSLGKKNIESARRESYETLFELVRKGKLDESSAYSAWLFLGQLEGKHGGDKDALLEAYSYFTRRVTRGSFSEWANVGAGSSQMSRKDFKGTYRRIRSGQTTYSEAVGANRERPRVQDRKKGPPGWAPGGRIVGKYLEQLALLLECGIPVTDALDTLRSSGSDPHLDHVTSEMLTEISTRGTSLSQAMLRHPKCFPSPVIALIRAGESVGALTKGLKRAAALLERQAQFQARVKQAISSPAIILSLGSVIIFGIVKFIIPKFLEVYDQMNLEMPALSQLVIRVVSLVNNPWFLVFLAISAGLIWRFREPIRQKLFDWALETPVIGGWIKVGLAKEMCDILSDLHSSGVPLQRSFQILADCTRYNTHKQQVLRAAESVQTEGSLSHALLNMSTLPKIVAIMAHVGEEAGTLDTLLRSLSKVLDDELETSLGQFVTTIEPVALTILGVGIAVLFVGLFLPIYGVIGNLS